MALVSAIRRIGLFLGCGALVSLTFINGNGSIKADDSGIAFVAIAIAAAAELASYFFT